MTQPTAANVANMEGADYAFVQDLVGSIPELAALVKNLAATGATAAQFEAGLEATTWWRTNSATARQMVALQSSDPATYQQEQSQAQAHVQQMASQMGITLSSAQVQQYATTDLFQGLNDDQLKSSLGTSFGTAATTNGQTPTGDVAQYDQQLQQLAASYGVPVTQAWTDNYIKQALSSGQSAQEMLAGATADLTQQAVSAYPPLAQQLMAGQTTSQIAQPYMAAMSNILEIPSTNINLNDPTIQKALTNPSLAPGAKTPSSVATPQPTPGSTPPATSVAGMTNQPAATTMSLFDFQNQLRADPRWQQTDNAKQSAYSMVASLGKSFGFAS